MLLECTNCGAPLDVAEGASSVRCKYCGQRTKAAKFKTVAQVTPPGWQPPPQWTPPASTSLPQKTLRYGAGVRRFVFRAGLLWAIGSLAVVAYGVHRASTAVQQATGSSLSEFARPENIQATMEKATAAITAAKQLAEAAGRAAEQTKQSLGDRVPIVCSGNDDVTITGKTLSLPGGSPIVASGNCSLRLVACTVSGASAIVAKQNAHVVLEGGAIAGTGPAVQLSDNARLEASSGVRFSGEATITANDNAIATIRDSSVSAKSVAVKAGRNTSVDTGGSTIVGKVVGPAKR